MKKEIKLNELMVSKINNFVATPKDLVEFVLGCKDASTDKEDINTTALKDIKINGMEIIKAEIDIIDNVLVLELEGDNKNKELLNVIKEEIKSSRKHIVLNTPSGSLEVYNKDTLIINNDGNFTRLYFLDNSYNVNGENITIHGNAKENILKDFINIYSYEYIVNEVNQDLLEQQRLLQKQEDNKYLIEALAGKCYSKVNEFLKDNEIKVSLSHITKRYNFEFYVQYSKHCGDCFRVQLNNNGNGFIFYENENWIEVDEEYIVNSLNKKLPEYKKYYDEVQEQKRIEIEEDRIKQHYYNIAKIIYNCDSEVVIKGKSGYICYNKGIRNSLKGSGKFYKCSFIQLKEIIEKSKAYFVNYENNSWEIRNNLKELNFIEI